MKIKIISFSILLSILLNVSLHSITLNSKLDFLIAFSCVGSTITYSYNPIQLTKGLKDNLVNCLYKNSDKQNKKEHEKNSNKNEKKDFIIAAVSGSQIQTVKQSNNLIYEKFIVKDRDRSLTNNLLPGFLNSTLAFFAFYFMLLMWLAITFRKRWSFLQYIKIKKHMV